MEQTERMIKDPDWDFLYEISVLSLEYIRDYIIPDIEKDMKFHAHVANRFIHSVKSTDIMIQPFCWINKETGEWKFTMYVYREVECRTHKRMGTLPVKLFNSLIKGFPETATDVSDGGVTIKGVKNKDDYYEVYAWNPPNRKR